MQIFCEGAKWEEDGSVMGGGRVKLTFVKFNAKLTFCVNIGLTLFNGICKDILTLCQDICLQMSRLFRIFVVQKAKVQLNPKSRKRKEKNDNHIMQEQRTGTRNSKAYANRTQLERRL